MLGSKRGSLPAPMPFSPFSSSAKSLKFRGTWATAMTRNALYWIFNGVQREELAAKSVASFSSSSGRLGKQREATGGVGRSSRSQPACWTPWRGRWAVWYSAALCHPVAGLASI